MPTTEDPFFMLEANKLARELTRRARAWEASLEAGRADWAKQDLDDMRALLDKMDRHSKGV